MALSSSTRQRLKFLGKSDSEIDSEFQSLLSSEDLVEPENTGKPLSYIFELQVKLLNKLKEE